MIPSAEGEDIGDVAVVVGGGSKGEASIGVGGEKESGGATDEANIRPGGATVCGVFE